VITTVVTIAVAAILAYTGSLWLLPALGLLDFPERYGLQRPRLPYPAGTVAIAIFIVSAPWILAMDLRGIGVLIAILLLGITCCIDDRTPLPFRVRLLIHVLVGLILFATGSMIHSITNPIGGAFSLDRLIVSVPSLGNLPLLSGLFTVAWLLLTINALNWFDGIPGQVSLLSTIGFLMLGFLATFRNGEADVALLSFSLAAIAGAGAVFEFPPAKMLIGDTGSMFFGLMLGLLGVYHGGKVATIFLVLGIPLLDAFFVIISRSLKGQSPFKGGRDHLHHLLLDRGWSQRSIVILLSVIGALAGGMALFQSTVEKVTMGIVLALLVGGVRYAARRDQRVGTIG
jgi:UDP-GlcNAc:undecaprenyl-phosphate/decaprenyl-phosphate GlcNAc-1-phosphate transferase